MNEPEKSPKSWWYSLPGMLTALAALITAITGLLVASNQMGLLSQRIGPSQVAKTEKTDRIKPEQEKNVAGNSAEIVEEKGHNNSSSAVRKLKTGSWTFEILNTYFTDEYIEKYYQEARTILPQGRNDKLFVIEARLTNHLSKRQSLKLTERYAGNTGIIDKYNRTYAPYDFDARQARDKIQSYESAPFLPGGAADFALVFSVPKNTIPKTLLFTIQTYLGQYTRDISVDLN